MANNIYDLAGNYSECTQEAYNTGNRADRGGSCYSVGSSSPASKHNSGGDPGFDKFSGLRFSSHFNNKVALDSRV